MNKTKIPLPAELKTFDFIISSGIDIDVDSREFSISYISSEEPDDENNKSNANKNIFNVKAQTMNKTIEKLQSLTNKSLSDSHLEYILIGEDTAKENLDYFNDFYSKNSNIRLDAYTFITKDMTSESFIKKILTSKIDVDARLDGLVNDKTQLCSLTKKNLKDMMQIFYSKNKTGVIPVLSVKESPIKSEESPEDEKDEKYTFEFYGLGILNDGKLTDYLPYQFVRTYLILTKNVKMTDIEITDENDNVYVFSVKNSKNNISFQFNKTDIPEKVIFTVNIDTNFDETSNKEKNLTEDQINRFNKIQSEKIKSEIDEIINISKKIDVDFLNIGDSLSVQHPYKWHGIKDDWRDILKNMDYEINVSVKGRRK